MNRDEYYAALKVFSNELSHHGILGQKWGVRRFQNPDGSLTPAGLKRYQKNYDKDSYLSGYRKETSLKEKTLPKGLKVYRISNENEDTESKTAVYLTTNTPDRDRVRGISDWLSEKQNIPRSALEEKEFTLNRDIKIPSQEEVRSVQHEIFSNEKLRSTIALEYAVSLLPQDSLYNTSYKDFLKRYDLQDNDIAKRNYKESKDYDTFEFNDNKLQVVNSLINSVKNKTLKQLDSTDTSTIAAKTVADFAVGASTTYKKALVDELSKRGYNAMYDNAMIRAGSSDRTFKKNEAYEPIVLFEGKDLTRNNDYSRRISDFDVNWGLKQIYKLKEKD